MAYETFWKNLAVPNYKQGSSPWGTELTSCGGTMASEGCIITSVAMIIDYIKCDVTPGELLENMKNHNGADCEFVWSVAGSLYGCTYMGKTFGNFNSLKADIFERVVLGSQALLLRIGNQHTIVVKGFNGTLPIDADNNIIYSSITSDMFKVNDPGSSTHSTLEDVINHYGTDITYFSYYYPFR